MDCLKEARSAAWSRPAVPAPPPPATPPPATPVEAPPAAAAGHEEAAEPAGPARAAAPTDGTTADGAGGSGLFDALRSVVDRLAGVFREVPPAAEAGGAAHSQGDAAEGDLPREPMREDTAEAVPAAEVACEAGQPRASGGLGPAETAASEEAPEPPGPSIDDDGVGPLNVGSD